MLRSAGATAVAVALLMSAASAPALADDPGVEHGLCFSGAHFCVGSSVGTSKPPSRGGGQASASSRGKGAGKKSECTLTRMSPQPPPGTLYYLGEGVTVYLHRCADGIVLPVAGAAGAAPPAVDPAQLAQQAVDKMALGGPRIASPRAAGKYTVGVPMWMWVNPSATTFGPNSASASAGGITVTATAKVSSIKWSMGDGESVTCNGPGTKYRDSYGMSASPTCGYRYKASSKDRADGQWHGTATSTWSIHWEVTGGGGGEGDLTHQAAATAFTVHVGEMRVLD